MTLNKIAILVLSALCAVTILLSIKFIVTQKWSNIDEYAHMDYIEKLAIGKMPVSSDQITDEIFYHTLIYPQKSVVGKPLTREGLGLANYSYQAQHPPLYYAILLIPNKILKIVGVPLFKRLIVLRLISYSLFVLGLLLCIPICKLLNQLNFRVPTSYGWACVLFGLLIATHERYGLGNNQLSPLFINASIILLLRYFKKPINKYLYQFILLMCLSSTIALSNLFAFPILFGVLFFKYKHNFTIKNFCASVSIVLPFIVFFILWKTLFLPQKEVGALIRNFLDINIPANFLGVTIFIKLFLEDMFTLSFINKGICLSYSYAIILIANSLMYLLFYKTLFKKQLWLVVGFVFNIYFILLMWYLNANIEGYTWVAFRHYQGLIPFFFISCSGFMLVLYSKYKNRTSLKNV